MRRRTHRDRAPARTARGTADRAVLVCEQLEGRDVPTPLVFAPSLSGPFQAFEPAGSFVPLALVGSPLGGGQSFGVGTTSTNPATTTTATLGTNRGFIELIALDGTQLPPSVNLVGNGTPSITLIGSPTDVNDVLDAGYRFIPNPGYSGDATVSIQVTESGSPSVVTAGVPIQVFPVASFTFIIGPFDQLQLRSGPFNFPSDLFEIASWADNDGSEEVQLSLGIGLDDSALLDDFVLLANGTPIPTSNPGLWNLPPVSSPAAFTALIDSLTLVSPSDFSGFVSVDLLGSLVDTAVFADAPFTISDSRSLFGSANLRFFEPAVLTTPSILVPHGIGAVDLGGLYAVSDPAEIPEDTYTLTITSPGGPLGTGPAPVPVGLSVVPDGPGRVVLTGELSDINQYLSTPGSLVFTNPDPRFVGQAPLMFTLVSVATVPDGDGGSFQTGPSPPTNQVAFVVVAPPPDSPGAPPPGDEGFGIIPGSGSPPPGGFPPPPGSGPRPRGFSSDPFGGPPLPPGFDDTRPFEISDRPGDIDGGQTSSEPLDRLDSPEASSRTGGEPGPGTRGADGANGFQRPFEGYLGGSLPGREARLTRGDPREGRDGPPTLPTTPALTRAEVQALYGGESTRHPLPPVLPLDQTLPVAGFSEPTGDSLGLIDQIYRDAGATDARAALNLLGEPAYPPAAPVPAQTRGDGVPPTPAPQPAAVRADTEPADPTAAGPTDPAVVAEPIRAEYLYAAAAAAVLIPAAAWTARAYRRRAARAAVRLFHTSNRQTTQGST